MLGAAAAAGSDTRNPLTAAIGGVLGAGVQNAMQTGGLPPGLSAAAGGGVGGALTGFLNSSLAGKSWQSLNALARGVQAGGLGGIMCTVAGLAVSNFLKRGNQCHVCEEE
jgi:hypothetical protein